MIPMTRFIAGLFILTAGPLAAQVRKPVIEQPSRPSGVASGTYGPVAPPKMTGREKVSRAAARSDTTEILEALAHKLRVEDRDVLNSSVTIHSDTAWVALMDPKFRGATHRLERRHTWKVVE
jgi:hypothetical protein